MLCKVKLISTSGNDCGNKKNCEECVRQGLLLREIFHATCVATRLLHKSQEKLPSITEVSTLAAFPRNAKITGRDTSLGSKTISPAFANPKLFESIEFRPATKKELRDKIRLLAAKSSLTEYDEVSSRLLILSASISFTSLSGLIGDLQRRSALHAFSFTTDIDITYFYVFEQLTS